VGWERIVAIFDAAGLIEPPQIPDSTLRNKSARRQPRSNHPSSPSPAEKDDPSSFSSFSPPDPRLDQNLAETLATEQELLELAIEECAALDHSDTDNGKRLIRYFGKDLLVRQESGTAQGAWLRWVSTHWDIDNGAAGAAIVSQTVGELIMEEARFIVPTESEQRAIDAGRNAERELKELAAAGESEERGDQVARLALLELAIGDAKAARGAVAKRRGNRRKWGLGTKMRARMAAMLECAGPHMRCPPEDFNTDPLLVATQTHTLRFAQRPDPECPDPDVTRLKCVVEADVAHRREDLITALVPVAYDPDADCPKWRANLERFQPDEKQRRTIQQFAGVGLLGKPIQRVMFHYGTGANFKSVFLETVTRVLGKSFAVGLPTESLIGGAEASAGGARPDLERVFGKRMLRILELPEGVRLKADLIKKLTGGEAWPVRTLYKSFFEFTPCAKTHMSGNSFPEFDGSDGGMRRRLIVMEWPVTIVEADQLDIDIVLADLMTEASGILNWLIAGALDYLENGLVLSEKTRAFTQEYFDEMDPTARFVRDYVAEEAGHVEKARDMYKAYIAHCAANARKPVFETRFGRILKKRFKHDDTGRVRVYVDVRLHDVPEVSSPEDARNDYRAGLENEFPG
jgi:putative DNA primase/helicase